MNIQHEWKRHDPGPDYDPTNLTHLIRYFRERRSDPKGIMAIYRDHIWDECRDAPSFEAAIVAACRSVRPNTGKMHHHQSKVPHMARFALCHALVFRAPTIERVLDRREGEEDFDWLHDGVEYIGQRIENIGPMTIYDVSCRISAFLDRHYGGMAPDKVYLHQGCKLGAKALGLPHTRKWLLMEEFPKELQVMDADELEDFLCAHIKVLGDTVHELRGANAR